MKTKIIVIIILVLVLGFTGWRVWDSFFKNSSDEKSSQEQAQLPSINGNLVDPKQAKLRPLAIVIENHSDSRPQSGLTDAEIVYETLAEGGITRFLAIFQTREPKTIGPVRSARPYFNFLADIWHAPLIHAGGSEKALQELNDKVYKNLYDINEFSFGKYFTRDKLRVAPHNLYTTMEDQRDLLDDKNQTAWEARKLWETQNTPTDQLKQEVTNITLPFSIPSYEVSYKYDPATNSYQRSIAGKPAVDRNNNLVISPKNVLVMLTDITPVPGDEKLTVNIKVTGSGPCYLFNTGVFKQCKWEHKDGKHVYTNQDGTELKLETGQTWIEIFPRDRQNEIKWN
jgi:hypothetical protein